ncbi:centrosomal protein of 41 kDa-like isoform X1 [Lingula anatina]|uniref:Centrosomal protein of 41 kDa-like isoform X1 n=1 Tax=Lingula anatina TaxID=7574 RepID=A0A1S3J3K8_LINAN|nr:centrosomal protein of 41 kDa-like isoform X1 [Lingula anatina]|eukprot:XP_013404843.1 centrosomal protein of 41 kDa-like isoform X1 [Lingula anatina]
MSAVSRQKKLDPLSRKVPENPKYQHVKATVDTGASLNKYMSKIEEIRRNYRYKKDELFKRMKVTTFVQLVIQVAEVHQKELAENFPDLASPRPGSGDTVDNEIARIQGGVTSPAPSLAITEGDFGPGDPPDTARSTLQSVIKGVGEVDLNAPTTAPPPASNLTADDFNPYLVLDVRDVDAYNDCHIISALSFPSAMLSRSCNYESKELLAYRNQPGKIIVIYDDDERIAPHVATVMVERGYENLFMLSGGLKFAYANFPRGLITGTPPPVVQPQRPKQAEKASQRYFHRADVDMLMESLDNALMDKSTGSRLTKASTASSRMGSVSQMTNRSLKSSIDTARHSKPFKP